MKDPIEEARQQLFNILNKEKQTNALGESSVAETMESFSEIFEELHVAEQELRQQNEELVETRQRIEDERQRYQELFEYAPDAYLVTDEKGLIQAANQAAGELINVPSAFLSGKPFLIFISEDDLIAISKILRGDETVHDKEIGVRPRHGKRVYVSVTTNRLPGKNNQPAQIRWVLRDVTERRKALAALDASEERFRTIFDQAKLGIVLLDQKGMITRTNPAFLEMLGIQSSALPDHFFALLEDPQDGPPFTQAFQAVVRGKQPVSYQKIRLKGGEGRTLWAGVTLSPMRNDQNRVQFVVAMVENITAEHQAGVELVEMRRRLLESGEAERLRLAQDLHDGPMQDLYGAVFHLNNLPGLEGNPESEARIKEIQEILKRVAGTLRAICGELRPPTLTNLGLERAIRSHAEQIQDLHPEITFQLQLTHEGQVLPADMRMALFRIYQQCMTNVLRHAQASRVMISFHVDDREAVLDIWDNGKGFTLPEKWVELLREGHYGLAGIAERVDAIGGVLKIDTRPGAGTLVHIAAPLAEHTENIARKL